jgi:hypothetical protein
MFDSVQPHSTPETTQSQPTDAVVRPQIGDPDAQQSVYTLPKEFLPKKRFLPTNSGRGAFFASWKVIALLIGIVVVMIAIVGVLVYWVMQQNETSAPQAFPLPGVVNTNTTTVINGINSGTALNLNVNQSLNGNVNAGLFPNVNTNTNTSVNTAAPSGVRPFSVKTTVPLAEDRDKDQLTDAEEALYGTKVGLPDSDGDGFIDGSEVLRGYSPMDAKKTLRAGGVVLPFANSSFGWSMDYPAKWVAGSSDDSGKSVLFTSDSVEGEYVQVVMTDNPQGLTAKEWYVSLFTDADPAVLQEVTIAGLSGIISPDGYTYYLADTNTIIGIIYNYGTKNAVSFKTTFQMMVTSFTYDATTVKKTTPTTGAGTNNTLTPSIPASNTNATVNTNTTTNKSSNANSTVNTNSNKNINSSNTNARNTNLNSNTNTNTVRTIQ